LGCKIENTPLDSIPLHPSLEKQRKRRLSFAVGGPITSCIQADWKIIPCKFMQMKQQRKPNSPKGVAGDTYMPKKEHKPHT
jgi:hypothetical protein